MQNLFFHLSTQRTIDLSNYGFDVNQSDEEVYAQQPFHPCSTCLLRFSKSSPRTFKEYVGPSTTLNTVYFIYQNNRTYNDAIQRVRRPKCGGRFSYRDGTPHQQGPLT